MTAATAGGALRVASAGGPQGMKSRFVGSGLLIGVSRYGEVWLSAAPSDAKNCENCS
jgi:hypothetical protein